MLLPVFIVKKYQKWSHLSFTFWCHNNIQLNCEYTWYSAVLYILSMGWLAHLLIVYTVVMCLLVNQVLACRTCYTVAARWCERCLVLQQHTAIHIRVAPCAARVVSCVKRASFTLTTWVQRSIQQHYCMLRSTGSLPTPLQCLCCSRPWPLTSLYQGEYAGFLWIKY